MTHARDMERRFASDRRRFARGGRRPTDKAGFAPLVLVGGDDEGSRKRCEEILCALKFAVVPADSVDETIRALRDLRPNLVISNLRDIERLRIEIASNTAAAAIPLITIDESILETAPLVAEIRRVLRARNTLHYPRTG